MELTTQEQKTMAIQFMQQLGVDKHYIKEFEKDGKVYCYEEFKGAVVEPAGKLGKRIRDFEKKSRCLVYAVTHEFMMFGECYNFLYVSPYEEDLDHLLKYCGNNIYLVSVYAWNVTDEICSEFGYVNVANVDGGLGRIG